MEKLQKSMNNYVKSIQKRSDTDDRDKLLPAGYLGAAMVSHGQDFQPDSEFGNCLISMDWMRYVLLAGLTMLQTLEGQMKHYRASRNLTGLMLRPHG